MQSYTPLGDISSEFANYWRTVKDSINELANLPAKISALDAKVYELQKRIARNTAIPSDQRKALIYELGAKAPRIGAMKQTAVEVAGKINNYLQHWRSFAASAPGLGIAPVLAAGALAALAYVAVQGMSLLKEYKQEAAIIAQVETKGLSIEEAKALIKAGKQPTFGGELGGTMGMTIGLAVLAVGGYLAWQYVPKRASTVSS